MTFLNPFLLIGLVAAAIPIIIHLLNLRKLKTVEFSSLQFLKELQKTKMRRVRIRQWILLALRTLLIISLVIAFSRPALKGSFAGTLGSHAKTTTVILLDDSPSMSIRNERGTLFAQAKATVAQILELLKEGDETYLIPLSKIRHNETFSAAHSAGELNTMFAQLATTEETVSYRDAVGAAAKILSETKNFNQEVYLIGDGQATQFAGEKSRNDSTKLFGLHTRIFLIDSESPPRDNTGIVALDIMSTIIVENKPVNLRARVGNWGKLPVKNVLLSAYLEGTRIVQQSIDIAANGSTTVDLVVVPKHRGTIKGYLQLEDDALEIDNKRFFVLDVPKNINVLLAGAAQEDTRLLSLALTPGNDTSSSGLFSVRKIAGPQLSATDLTRFDVLILCGVKDFSFSEAERIADFVNAGGGLMLFPGKESDIKNYDETLFARLKIPPAQVASLPGTPLPASPSAGFLTFGTVDYAHPLFTGLLEQQTSGRKKEVESPRISNRIVTNIGQGHSIIALSDGSGFLTEYACGNGRVLLYSVGANLSWSDFPVKGVFAPLLHRSTVYLAVEHQRTSTYIVGEPIQFNLRIKNTEQKHQYLLRSAGGIEELVMPQFRSSFGTALFESSNTSETGIYELAQVAADHSPGQNLSELLDAVAVNVSPAESDLRRARNDELSAFWNSVGLRPEQINQLHSLANINAAILESRFGVELWKYFIVLAILLALAEMAISREQKSSI